MFLGLRGWLYWRKLAGQIRKRGWTGIHIYGKGVGWSYTVGLARHGWPEVVISGTSLKTADVVLAEMYRKLRSGELTIVDGESWTLPEWVTCAWRRVHPERVDQGLVHFATRDRWYQTGDPNLDAYQLVFPDEKLGRLPWEEGFDEGFRRLQEELWLAPEPEEAAARTLH